MPTVLVDTGPLIALWDPSDQHHRWAGQAATKLIDTLHTCESVLTEAFFLLARVPKGRKKLITALRRPSFIKISWKLETDLYSTLDLLEKYKDTPASLADACLVSMAETARNPVIWTTDSHFKIYRLRNGKKIPLIAPNYS